MGVNDALKEAAKMSIYRQKAEIPKVMSQIVREYRDDTKKDTMYTYAKEILSMCYKIKLTELYGIRLRDSAVSTAETEKLNEKKKFLVSEPVKRQYNSYNRWDKKPQVKSRPMDFNELHDELQSQLKWFVINKPEKKVEVQADLTVLAGLKEKKADRISNGKLLDILKATACLVLEVAGAAQDAYPELTDFQQTVLSHELQCEDTTEGSDFKDPAAVAGLLTTAIQDYKRYQEKMICCDAGGAALRLRTACLCGYSCYESSLKNYLYQWTEYLARNGKRTEEDLSRIDRLVKPDGSFMDIGAVRREFNDLQNEVTDPKIGAPVIQADWDLLKAGWQVYTQVKHRVAVPKADALEKELKEIIRLTRQLIPSIPRNLEWDRFLSGDQEQNIQELQILQETQKAPDDPQWVAFRELCGNFDSDSYHYILVAPANLESDSCGRILAMQWDMIIDMNPSSREDGLMYTYEQMYQMNVEARTPGEHLEEFRPIAEPYWIRGNGRSDAPEGIKTKYRSWKFAYGNHLQGILAKFHSTYTRPVKIIYLPGHDPEYQNEIMDAAIMAFYDNKSGDTYGVEQILLDNHDLIEDYDETSFRCANISMEKMLEGFAGMNMLELSYQRRTFPGMKAGEEIENNLNLERYFTPVYMSLGMDINDQGKNVREFYRGVRKISWNELALDLDLRREIYTNDILPRVRKEIMDSSRPFCTIGYKPGYGGTTMLRRLAWDLHKEYPTLIVHDYDASCVQQLMYLRSKLEEGTPLILLIDSNDMSENDARALHGDLGINSVTPTAIVYFKRREYRRKEFAFVDELNQAEINRMVRLLEQTGLDDFCLRKLRQMRINPPELRDRTPFWLSMYAYDKDFVGFSSYVRNFLSVSSQEKYRKFLLYTALQARARGQRLDAEFFAYHMENVQTGKEAMELLLKRDAFANLVVFENEGKTTYCRMRHSRIAEEVLIQLTNGIGADKDDAPKTINYSVLATYLQQFIQDTRVRGVNGNLEKLLQWILIERDNSNYEVRDSFSPIILDISRGGKGSDKDCTLETQGNAAQVLKTLSDCYEDNPHFAAHYGRFLSDRLEAHDEAQRVLERANSIKKNDSNLLHMLGTVFYRKAEAQIKKIKQENDRGRDYADLLPQLRLDVAKASEKFEEASRYAYSSVAGMLSNIKLCIRVIEMDKYLEKVDTETYFQLPQKEWYLALRDRANELFEECEKFHDYMNETDLKNYEELEAQIQVINEASSKCIRFYEARLQEADPRSQAMLRRQMAYVYNTVAKRENNTDAYMRIMALMNDNIQDDPTNTANYRQWFRAAFNSRCADEDLVSEAMSKVNQWLDADPQDFQAHFYRYMLTFLQAYNGVTLAEAQLKNYRTELQNACRNRGIHRLGDTKFVLVHGTGLQCLSPLRFDLKNVEEARKILLPVRGTLEKREKIRQGYISSFQQEVLFDPRQTNGAVRDNDFKSNARVTYGVLFTYDGIRAYDASVKLETGKQDQKPLAAGRAVKCAVLAQGSDYLILNIQGYSEFAKMYYDDLQSPFSTDNVPALGVVLNAFLEYPEQIRYKSQNEWGWVVTMEKTPGTAHEMNKPMLNDPKLMQWMEMHGK